MMIVNAKFLSSASAISNAPPESLSEVAFLGRSNVGKSTLINALCKQKGLAKSSSTPGKTRLINFFEVDFKNEGEKSKLIFVDLPGFGYARVSKSLKQEWDKSLHEFLNLRKSLKLFIHLIDSRHLDLEIDKNINEYLSSLLTPTSKLLTVFTKADKLNQSEKSKLKNTYKTSILVSKENKKSLAFLEDTLYKMALGHA